MLCFITNIPKISEYMRRECRDLLIVIDVYSYSSEKVLVSLRNVGVHMDGVFENDHYIENP